MNVVIFGPPGAGKGTQSQNLVKKFNLFQVSTGDLLRNEIKNKSEIGKEIEEIISKGGRVNTRRENRLEELGRVDAERARTQQGKQNLRQEKRRIVRELKK